MLGALQSRVDHPNLNLSLGDRSIQVELVDGLCSARLSARGGRLGYVPAGGTEPHWVGETAACDGSKPVHTDRPIKRAP